MAEQSQSTTTGTPVSKVTEVSNTFALNLYQSLQPRYSGENLFFSPLSISTALAMTYMGSRGDTATQMEKVLSFSLAKETNLHRAFQEINELLYNPTRPYILKSANRLFVQKGGNFLPDFLDGTRSCYGAQLEAVDFKGETEATRKLINSWVEEQTAQKITDLLPEESLNSLVRLVLVNAIYFKGDWASQFDVRDTYKEPFHLSASKSVNVSMMHQDTTEYMFADDQDNKCKIVQLPYKGGHLSMVVLLPDEIEGLSKIEANLDVDVLNRMMSTLSKVKVQVSMPKFKFTQSFNLHETLSQMGIEDLFIDGKADLSGINGERDLYVSKVVHKAFIEVNEEGREAAAATAMYFYFKCRRPPTPEFKADHPFIFFIRDNSTVSRTTNCKAG